MSNFDLHLFKNIVEKSSDIIMRFDRQHRHLYVNSAVTRYTGIEPEVFVGKTHAELGFPKELASFCEQKIEETFEKLEDTRSELRFDSLLGHVIFDWIMIPERDENGNVNSILSISRDVTELKKAYETVNSLDCRMQMLFDSMLSGFAYHKIVCNESGVPVDYIFLNVNTEFENLTGLKRENILNMSVKEVMPNNEDYWIAKYGEVALSGNSIVFTNYSCEIGKWFEVNAYSPEHGYFVVTFNDVTANKKGEEDLMEAMRKAEVANIAKSQFLSNMSHEIRTPMNGIIGMLQLLELTELDDSQHEYLGYISMAADSLLRILNDIIDYSRIEDEKLPIIKSSFMLKEMIEQIWKFFEISAQQKGINFEMKFVGDLPEEIIGDNVRVRQVLSNIIGNAIKFTVEGSVELLVKSIYRDNEKCSIKFAVKDTGIGIPEDKMGLLFQRFSQVDSSYSKKFAGAGLGLVISKKLVDLMDGEITVNSQADIGSEFCVVIPFDLAKIEDVTVYSENCTEYIPCNVKKKILLVEDDELSRKYAYKVLGTFDVEVIVAKDGKQAIDEYQNNDIALIFMDVQMPVMDGLTATHIIRETENYRNKRTPIVALTAYANLEDKNNFLENGMDDYLLKPYKIDEFIEIIKKWLNTLK